MCVEGGGGGGEWDGRELAAEEIEGTPEAAGAWCPAKMSNPPARTATATVAAATAKRLPGAERQPNERRLTGAVVLARDSNWAANA